MRISADKSHNNTGGKNNNKKKNKMEKKNMGPAHNSRPPKNRQRGGDRSGRTAASCSAARCRQVPESGRGTAAAAESDEVRRGETSPSPRSATPGLSPPVSRCGDENEGCDVDARPLTAPPPQRRGRGSRRVSFPLLSCCTGREVLGA